MERLRILFIDNRLEEITRQWSESNAGDNYELIPFINPAELKPWQNAVFNAVMQASEKSPDIVVIGFDLGDLCDYDNELQDGADVIKYLRGSYGDDFQGRFIANTGGGVRLFSQKGVVVDASADRTAEGLREALSIVTKQIELYRGLPDKIDNQTAQTFLDSKPMDFEKIEREILPLLKGKEGVTPQLELLLEAFLQSRQHVAPLHGNWVHALSHFIGDLWSLRLTDWIKRFHEAAFKGAIELGDTNCSERLLSSFAHYALWHDDPKDFGLTGERISWMRWTEGYLEIKNRIEAGPFESEEALLDWKDQQPKK